ncbi:MAG: hypothetical protein PUH03_02260 [bacterium]|nr:hypothetical protein [bacterium]MDY2830985.1 hypothetical protein [Alphaproteobacteria bacterium]
MKHTFNKGHKKFGGRKMGTPNKSKEIADRIMSFVCNRDIDKDLQELYQKHLVKYWDIVSKFFPKPQQDDTDDRELNIIIRGYHGTEKDKK